MLTTQNLIARKNGIGGSDAASIFGKNPYKSQMQLYLDKTNKEIAPQTMSEPQEIGNLMEPVIAELFSRRTNKKCIVDERTHVHSKFPWMLCHIDRGIEGESALLECKNVGGFLNADKWGEEGTDNIPDNYLIQCVHNAAVLNVEKVYLSAMFGGNHFRTYIYQRNKNLEEAVTEGIRLFWNNHVVLKIPPTPKTIEDAKALWNKAIPEKSKTASNGSLLALEQIKRFSSQSKESKDVLDSHRLQLMQDMSDAEYLVDYAGNILATWKNQIQVRVDTKLLKEKYPNVHQAVSKTIEFRVLRIKGEE